MAKDSIARILAINANKNSKISADSASTIGFVSGTSLGTEAETNRVALNAFIAAGGGKIYFPAGDWDFRFASSITLNSYVSLTGESHNTTRFLCQTIPTSLFVLTKYNFELSRIHFYAGTTKNSSGFLINFDATTGDFDYVKINLCKFTEIYRVLSATSSNSAKPIYGPNNITIEDNIFNCPNGTGRLMVHKAGTTKFINNWIDGGVRYDTDAQHGGIICGFVDNDSNNLDPYFQSRVYIQNNIIRRIRPSADPGSPGVYGIQAMGAYCLISGNVLEKIYPQTGTTITDNTILTGDGTTTTFTGTLSGVPNIDSFKLKNSSNVTIGDASDYGWAQPPAGLGSDYTTKKAFVSRQIIKSYTTDSTSWSGWVDCNTGAWSITFTTAPTVGVVYNAIFIANGASIANIEGIYCKSQYQILTNNRILDCSINQGALCPKGNGSNAYTQGVTDRYPGGNGSQYGAIVTQNIVRNRVQKNVFSATAGVWLQQDRALIQNNIFEGLTSRITQINCLGDALQITYRDNIIKDFYGNDMFVTQLGSKNVKIDGVDIDGVLNTGIVNVLKINEGGTNTVENTVLRGVRITSNCTASTLCIAKVGVTTGTTDLLIEDIKSLYTWTGVLKVGTGTAGRLRLNNYCTENMTAATTVASGGGQLAITNTTTAGSYT